MHIKNTQSWDILSIQKILEAEFPNCDYVIQDNPGKKTSLTVFEGKSVKANIKIQEENIKINPGIGLNGILAICMTFLGGVLIIIIFKNTSSIYVFPVIVGTIAQVYGNKARQFVDTLGKHLSKFTLQGSTE